MFKRIFSLLYIVFALLFMVFSSIVATTVSAIRPFGWPMYTFEKFWAKTLLVFTRAKIEVSGLENIQGGHPYIFISNHQSLFDIPLMMGYIPRQIRMIHKKELMWAPFLGITLLVMRFISIDRGNRDKAIVSLKRAAEKIKNGINIVIYAEGTRSLDGKISAFKKGAFLLAINSQVDIIPVTISGTINIMHKYGGYSNMGFKKPVHMIIGSPISTSGLTPENRDELKSRVERIISEQFEKIKSLSEIHDKTFLEKMSLKKKQSRINNVKE